MRNDQAFLGASVPLAEIQKHRTADCLRPSGIIKSTELEAHQAATKDRALGRQLGILASFHGLGLPTPKTSSDTVPTPLLLPALRMGPWQHHGL